MEDVKLSERSASLARLLPRRSSIEELSMRNVLRGGHVYDDSPAFYNSSAEEKTKGRIHSSSTFSARLEAPRQALALNIAKDKLS